MSSTVVTWHTAAKQRVCDLAEVLADCRQTIRKGDRYCKVAVSPNPAVGQFTWSKQRICTVCATGRGHVDPAMVGSAS